LEFAEVEMNIKLTPREEYRIGLFSMAISALIGMLIAAAIAYTVSWMFGVWGREYIAVIGVAFWSFVFRAWDTWKTPRSIRKERY